MYRPKPSVTPFNYVVFAFPDNGQTADEFAKQSGWTKLAEDNGFCGDFPRASGKTWSATSGSEDEYIDALWEYGQGRLTPPVDWPRPAAQAQAVADSVAVLAVRRAQQRPWWRSGGGGARALVARVAKAAHAVDRVAFHIGSHSYTSPVPVKVVVSLKSSW